MLSINNIVRRLALVLLLVSAVAIQSLAQGVTAGVNLYGISLYSDNPEYKFGIYRIPTGGGNLVELVAADPELETVYGACCAGDKYYVNVHTSILDIPVIMHRVYDVSTLELIESVIDEDQSFTTLATDMTYDATTGNIYGSFFNASVDGCQLAIQDPVTFKTSYIGELAEPLNSIAAAADGSLYGISQTGYLYSIDKTTAEMTLIGNTGIYPQYKTSATIDQMTGVLYWTVSDDFGGYLYTVDKTTAVANLVCEFYYQEEMVGLFIPPVVVADDAPSLVRNFTAYFDGDGLMGSLSFSMPTSTFGGSAIDGSVDYRVMRNGDLLLQGSALAGSEVKFDDTVPQTGYYTYMVIPSINGNDGPGSSLELWVGPDTPFAPGDVTLTHTGNTFKASWRPVTYGVHGGYIGDIVYRVGLYVDDVLVGSELTVDGTECTFTYEPQADLSLFQVKVEACSAKAVSAPAYSNVIALGSLNTPFMETFADERSLLAYTIIDANGDGVYWCFNDEGRLFVTYNSEEGMDDWLVTPAVKMQAGTVYHFMLGAQAASDRYPETLEVRMGKAADVSSLTDVVVSPVRLGESSSVFDVCVRPDADGEYYFGVHGMSDADMYNLYINYLGISRGVSVNAPAPCDNVKVVADPMGGLSASISFDAPTSTMEGATTEISKVEVYRDGSLIYTNPDVTPGQGYTLTDCGIPTEGYYTYTIVAYNSAGMGEVVEQRVFVGIGVPAVPEHVNIVERGNTGEVTISWAPPTHDAEGNYIDPSNVTYAVVDGLNNVVAEGLTDTQLSVKVDVSGQEFVYFGVFAVSIAGVSEPAQTPVIAVGEPYMLPLADSFNNGQLSMPFAIDLSGGGEWTPVTDYTVGIPDADGTNGHMVMHVEFAGQYAELFTGKVLLDGSMPVLSLATYCLTREDTNTLEVFVRDCATGETRRVDVIRPGDGVHRQWNMSMIDLSEYAGRCVQVSLLGTCRSYGYLFVDALGIVQPADVDLRADGLYAPAYVKAAEEFDLAVDVTNVGATQVDSFGVEISLNGIVVAEASAGPVAPLQSTTVKVPYRFSPLVGDNNVFVARVVCAGDADLRNNVTSRVPVDVVLPDYPVATDLKAEWLTDVAALTWSAPDLADLGMQRVADDFESYTPFAFSNIGDWTLVDADQAPMGGLSGVSIPGFTPGLTANAFFVMDYVALGLDQKFAAHSGQQYMMSVYTGYPQSDWLITPALSGDAQTVSFYARSYSGQYGLEEFEVYYSDTDLQIESFKLIEHLAAPAEWTAYSYDLPAGAKYFAIVCVSVDKLAFFVDDVTYSPAGAGVVNLSVEGYNVYRNGQLLNAEPVADCSYADASAKAGDTYVVTVVYNQGESTPSDPAKLDLGGIGAALTAAVDIRTIGRTVQVSGTDQRVSIYSTDGQLIYGSSGKWLHSLDVAPGVYIVKAGNLVSKVVVR